MTNSDPTPTPGPWHIEVLEGFKHILSPSGSHTIATVHYSSAETANARLIAAAPQLLEACKLALGHIHDPYRICAKCDCGTR